MPGGRGGKTVRNEAKEALRREMRRRRAELTPGQLDDWSAAVARRVLEYPAFCRARTVGLYLALPGEVRTEGLIEECRLTGRTVALPVFDDRSECCGMRLWTEGEPLVPGRWGVQEPQGGTGGPEPELDLIVVPGVAFTAEGGRLGRGGGHYDRLLAGRNAFRLGLAFEFQMAAALPLDGHDAPLDAVITEERIYGPERERSPVSSVFE